MNWHFLFSDDFTSHSGTWDYLNQNGPNSPLLDSRFIEPLIRYFGTGRERLAIAGDIENPVAMAIITKVKFGVWSTFQPSQAPVGLWLSVADISIDQLISSLAECLPGFPLVIGVTQLDPDFTPRPSDRRRISTMDYIQTARIIVDKPFEDYWSSRSKNLRHNLKRQRNKLEREGISTRLEVISQPEDMVQAVRQYGDLESSGWKVETGSAIHLDNVQGQVYLNILSAFSATGQARVYRYFYDDNLVACDLCVLGVNSLIILKTTYDETIEGSSPAMLMRQDVFERVFEEKTIRQIEFYGKVMDWHTKWSNDFRFMYHINFYPWKVFRVIKDKIFTWAGR